jgi:predicted PurR-regulated permease PerM
MPQANSKLPGWWDRNDFRCLRFVFALIVFGTVVIPLVWREGSIVNKDLKEFAPVTNIATETRIIEPAKKNVGNDSVEVMKQDKPDGQTTTKTEQVIGSASTYVWAYGLQLVAWAVVLSVSLWAVVALCRDE